MQRVMLVACAIFVSALTVAAFVSSDYKLSTYTIILVALLLVLCLSETFDHFHVGKILAISRQVTELETSNKTLSQENAQLHERVLKMYQVISTTSQSTSSAATHNSIVVHTTPKVESATAEEVAQKKEEEVAATEAQALPLASQQTTSIEATQTEAERDEFAERHRKRNEIRRLTPELERLAIKRFIESRQIPASEVFEQVKISGVIGTPLPDADPIIDRPMIYDAYIRRPMSETFVEVLIDQGSNPMLIDRLYLRIAKVLFYRQQRNIEADLVLLIIVPPPALLLARRLFDRPLFENVTRYFQPAVRNRLLSVERIQLTEDDLEAVRASLVGEENSPQLELGQAIKAAAS
jgi:hypothetical protein